RRREWTEAFGSGSHRLCPGIRCLEARWCSVLPDPARGRRDRPWRSVAAFWERRTCKLRATSLPPGGSLPTWRPAWQAALGGATDWYQTASVAKRRAARQPAWGSRALPPHHARPTRKGDRADTRRARDQRQDSRPCSIHKVKARERGVLRPRPRPSRRAFVFVMSQDAVDEQAVSLLVHRIAPRGIACLRPERPGRNKVAISIHVSGGLQPPQEPDDVPIVWGLAHVIPCLPRQVYCERLPSRGVA